MKPTEIIGNCHLYLGDCREVLPHLPKVDLVLTDPPYGIDIGKERMGKGKKSNSFESFLWDVSAPNIGTINDCIAKAETSIIWGGNYFGLPASGCFLSWDKVQEFSGADFELAWTNMKKPSKAFRMSRVEAYGNTERLHPTQKPIQLIEWCLNLAPKTTLTVADPFMGSGTTGVACANMGKTFYGIEREPKYFDIACKRIEAAYAQGRLFA
jgi:DNA modification methylase